MPSADFCPAVRRPLGLLSRRNGDTRQISRGKLNRLRCTTAGSTLRAVDGYGHLLRGPAKGVGTCVNWVLQHACDQPRRCRDKLDRPLAGALWQLDLFLPEPKINLPGTAQLPEFLKN